MAVEAPMGIVKPYQLTFVPSPALLESDRDAYEATAQLCEPGDDAARYPVYIKDWSVK
jgi:hypothetical protein